MQLVAIMTVVCVDGWAYKYHILTLESGVNIPNYHKVNVGMTLHSKRGSRIFAICIIRLKFIYFFKSILRSNHH